MNKAITEARIEQARRESENTAFHEWWKASGHADDPIFTLTMENCAHAAWQERASNQKTCPYGYVFGGCTFLHNGSPLLTAYVKDNSIPVFLRPSENVMETYVEVMGQKLASSEGSTDG